MHPTYRRFNAPADIAVPIQRIPMLAMQRAAHEQAIFTGGQRHSILKVERRASTHS